MAIVSLEKLTFSYPKQETPVLNDINLSIKQGDFVVLAGQSGSGKSTLLRLIKSEIAPHGKLKGAILYGGKPISECKKRTLAQDIGFVFQDPENQIVMDNVLDELSFGLENFHYDSDTMHKKIAEIVHFFDMNHLVPGRTADLSGGEKQLVNVASVLLLEPKVLLLDEPLAQLDPIAAKRFITMLKELNDTLGMTILIVEHRLDELLSMANQLILLDKGSILYDGLPNEVMQEMLAAQRLLEFLPDSVRLYQHLEGDIRGRLPVTVNEIRSWLQTKHIEAQLVAQKVMKEEVLLSLKNIDFQYRRGDPLLLDNVNMKLYEAEILTIVGGNGTGKSTLLKVIAGILQQQHGHFYYEKKRGKKLPQARLAYLPQNPQLIFVEETIQAEFMMLAKEYAVEQEKLASYITLFQLEEVLLHHPFDLSGGEIQRAALLATLLTRPKLLLLDEPTKGIDPVMKVVIGGLLERLQAEGTTILMVTHDIEFAAKYASRCGMLFQGELVALGPVEEFFNGNAYYTTMMNRVTRRSKVPLTTTLEKAVTRWRIRD